MKLLLWDIDGTLMCSGQAGERALVYALKKCFGIDGSLGVVDYFGRTDVLISQMLFDHYHIPRTPENQHVYLETYLDELRREMPLGPARIHAGVLEIIEKVRQRPDLVQGLLTGNIIAGAEIKLTHFNVWRYFEFGAFANDSHLRNELGPFALRRAQEHSGREFPPDQVYIIGDTPHDIACAKAIQAKCIAVATGHFTMDQLRAHDPTALLPNLADQDAFFAALEL